MGVEYTLVDKVGRHALDIGKSGEIADAAFGAHEAACADARRRADETEEDVPHPPPPHVTIEMIDVLQGDSADSWWPALRKWMTETCGGRACAIYTDLGPNDRLWRAWSDEVGDFVPLPGWTLWELRRELDGGVRAVVVGEVSDVG